jgi:uncharacterized protein (DUF4415 family)
MVETNMSNSSKTDWAKVDALTDQTIDASEVPPLGDAFFAKAKLRMPSNLVPVTLQVDSDVLAWFRQTGPGWEDRVRAALRIYAEAYQSAGGSM